MKKENEKGSQKGKRWAPSRQRRRIGVSDMEEERKRNGPSISARLHDAVSQKAVIFSF
jgi:hypothetical protein